MNVDRAPTRHPLAHSILTFAGMAGTAGIFLPFIWTASPWRAIGMGLGLIKLYPSQSAWEAFWEHFFFLQVALPACLAILVTIGAIRWLISGSLSSPERVIAYFAGASMMLLSLSIWFRMEPSAPVSWPMLSVYVLVLVLGVSALIRSLRAGWSRHFTPVMSMQVVYVAHVLMFLVANFGGWEAGAYCLLVAALAFALQIALVLLEAARRQVAAPAR